MLNKPNLKKLLKRIALVLGIAAFALIGLAFLVAKWYQKEMVASVTEAINENLVTPVAPLDVEVNFLSTFPSIGLTIKNVVFSDSSNGKQYPVLEIGKIKLVFGLAGLFSGQAIIHKAIISDGFYHEYKDKEGRRFKLRLKRKEKPYDPDKTKPVKFFIPVIELNRIKIISENVHLGNAIELNIEEGYADFITERLGILHISNAIGSMRTFKAGFLDLIEEAPFRISGTLILNAQNQLTSFNTSSGVFAGLDIQLNGFVKQVDDTSNFQRLHISGSKNNTQFLGAMLPPKLRKDSLNKDSSHTQIDLLMMGVKSKNMQPRVRITFNLKNGMVQNPVTMDGLTDIDVSGEIITNDPRSKKGIVHLNGGVKAHFKTIDLSNPEPEYTALFERYTKPDSVIKEHRKSSQEIPDDIQLRVNCEIDNLKYRNARATAVSFDASLNDKKISVESLKGNGFGGNFTLHTTMENRDNGGFNLNLEAQLNSIDVQSLFKQFNNFQQDYIRSEHLKGKASLHISGSTSLSSKFEPTISATQIAAQISFNKLELVRWPILIDALSKAKMEKQAEHLQLAKNELKFGLSKNVFYLAPVHIVSSLTTFDVSALQEINKKLDLITKLNIADQLLTSKKSKLRNIKEGTSESKERNWGFLYLHINGRPKNITVDVLKKETFEQIRQKHTQHYRTQLKSD